jgi:hypothetical protein
MHQQTEDDELEAALAALAHPGEMPAPDVIVDAEPSGSDSPVSPTLAALPLARRPKPDTVCEACPNSVWFASPKEVKCYCRVMFLVTWSSQEPSQIMYCDGVFLGGD